MTAAPTWTSEPRPSARPPRACRRTADPDPDITSPADMAWSATRPRLRKTSKRSHLGLVVGGVVVTEIPVTWSSLSFRMEDRGCMRYPTPGFAVGAEARYRFLPPFERLDIAMTSIAISIVKQVDIRTAAVWSHSDRDVCIQPFRIVAMIDAAHLDAV